VNYAYIQVGMNSTAIGGEQVAKRREEHEEGGGEGDAVFNGL
jgi:hypothetical protein